MTETLNRIMGSVPDYYGTSTVYTGIQTTKAAEWDRLRAQADDLALQLHPSTATWGLRYYEEALDIPLNATDSYEIRRSRVIAKRRSPGNFSAKLIKSVVQAFAGEVDVAIDFTTGDVIVTFIGTYGIPTNLDDLKKAVDGVVHAHLGVIYKFRYATYSQIANSGKTYGQIAATNITYEQVYEGGVL
ncbi:putative phage tail protein [Paenibacillus sp. BK720]|uniref:putative phage tail protein n=1 Tax=Paenibacillus sp. BK720 TaxID=2587092 RepID=UPI00141EA8C0|nr:putative phage tail protein [Paenibacillus sp. BK720]NIK67944.1 hypothetical protein [Paenibacillus sp. BK720]